MQSLTIPKKILDELVAEARRTAPHECCGYLAGYAGQVTSHYKIKNIIAIEGAEKMLYLDDEKIANLKRLSAEERAEIAFAMDSEDMGNAIRDIRKKQLDLQVIYHSHPHSPSRPSVTDIMNATEFESLRKVLNLAEPLHLIISLEIPAAPVLNAFRIADGAVTPIQYEIA